MTGQYGMQHYYESRPENQLSKEEYEKQMAELSAQVNRPGNLENFEDRLRDMEYGTINPNDPRYVGPSGEYDQSRLDAEYDFSNSISDFQPGLNDPTGNNMPQGGGKNEFDVQEEYEQYLRGGLIQRRR